VTGNRTCLWVVTRAAQHPFSQLRRHFPHLHALPDAVHLRIEAKMAAGRAAVGAHFVAHQSARPPDRDLRDSLFPHERARHGVPRLMAD
jgi:hypothetical protein